MYDSVQHLSPGKAQENGCEKLVSGFMLWLRENLNILPCTCTDPYMNWSPVINSEHKQVSACKPMQKSHHLVTVPSFGKWNQSFQNFGTITEDYVFGTLVKLSSYNS